MLSVSSSKDIGLVIAQWSEFQRVDGYVKTKHKIDPLDWKAKIIILNVIMKMRKIFFFLL